MNCCKNPGTMPCGFQEKFLAVFQEDFMEELEVEFLEKLLSEYLQESEGTPEFLKEPQV